MVWFILLVLFVAFMLGLAYKEKRQHDRRDHVWKWTSENGGGPYLVVSSIASIVFVGVSSIIMGTTYNDHLNSINSGVILEETKEQRDQIAKEFDDILSGEEFAQLMSASIPEDILFLKTNPDVSNFMLGRADRIVSLNARYFELRREVINRAKSVCNTTENPFIPQIWFLNPSCDLRSFGEL